MANERFYAAIEEDAGGCWLWTRSRNNNGYGHYWDGKRIVSAHRFAYELLVGEIPNGLYVLHTCDTPACVNPAHLFVGTQRDNVADCAEKGRRNQSRYVKLSPEAHDEIHRRYAAGGVSQSMLAREYGVAQATISFVVRKKSEPLTRSEAGKRRWGYACATG